jgi:hypothetical protein
MKRPAQPARNRTPQPLALDQLRAAHGGFSIGALITQALEDAKKEESYYKYELENVQVTS